MNFEINPALTSWINCNFPDTYILPWALGCLGLPRYNHPGSFPSKKIVGFSLLAMPKKSAKASKNDAVARDAVRPATSDEEILRQRRRSSTRVYCSHYLSRTQSSVTAKIFKYATSTVGE